MDIIYLKILKLKSFFLIGAITFFSLLISISCYTFSLYILDIFFTNKNIFYVFFHVLLLCVSYFFFKFFPIFYYKETFNIKEKIVSKEKKGTIITKWTYTKEESDTLKKHYTLLAKETRKDINIFFTIILVIVCVIVFFTMKLHDSFFVMYTCALLFFIIKYAPVDFNNFKNVLKQEQVTITFSKIGYLISDSYTGVFHTKTKRLTDIEYDDEKIYFTFSIYTHATPAPRSQGLGTPASVSSLTEEFPFPKRFEVDLKKLQQELHLYEPFSL